MSFAFFVSIIGAIQSHQFTWHAAKDFREVDFSQAKNVAPNEDYTYEVQSGLVRQCPRGLVGPKSGDECINPKKIDTFSEETDFSFIPNICQIGSHVIRECSETYKQEMIVYHFYFDLKRKYYAVINWNFKSTRKTEKPYDCSDSDFEEAKQGLAVGDISICQTYGCLHTSSILCQLTWDEEMVFVPVQTRTYGIKAYKIDVFWPAKDKKPTCVCPPIPLRNLRGGVTIPLDCPMVQTMRAGNITVVRDKVSYLNLTIPSVLQNGHNITIDLVGQDLSCKYVFPGISNHHCNRFVTKDLISAHRCGDVHDFGYIIPSVFLVILTTFVTIITASYIIKKMKKRSVSRRAQSFEEIPLREVAVSSSINPRYTRTPLLQLSLIALLLISSGTQACQQTFMVQSGEQDCRKEGDKLLCKHSVDAILEVPNLHSKVCLQFGNDKTTHELMVLQVMKHYGMCNPKNTFFTTEFKGMVSYERRCYNAGYCSGESPCAKYEDQTMNHFTDSSFNFKGYNRCVRQGSGWGDGCFYDVTGCLHWREFYHPIGNQYKATVCESWRNYLDLNITTSSDSKTFRSEEGQIIYDDKMEFLISNTKRDEDSLLSIKNINSGHQYVGTTINTPGTELKSGFFGELMCNYELDLSNLKSCEIAKDIVSCEPGLDSVSCRFFNNKNYERSLNALPYTKDTHIFSLMDSALIKTHLEVETMTLSISGEYVFSKVITEDECAATGLITGCYECGDGATVSVELESQTGDGTFYLSCPGIFLYQTADFFRQKSTLNFTSYLAQSNVDSECYYHCGTFDAVSSFQLKGSLIKGQLDLVNDTDSLVIGTDEGVYGTDWLDWFKNPFKDLASKFITITIVIISVILAFILISRYSSRRKSHWN
jgi:hypothetical protein